MTVTSNPPFQSGDQVIWWKQIPGGDTVYPVPATVLKVTAKRVQTEGDDDGRIVRRYVMAANLEKPGTPQPVPQLTELQGQYLAFIYNCTMINGRPPSEADMQPLVGVPEIHRGHRAPVQYDDPGAGTRPYPTAACRAQPQLTQCIVRVDSKGDPHHRPT